MLSELNDRLATVPENIVQLEGQFGEYFKPDRCQCTVNNHEVFLEYQHDLVFAQVSEQAQVLLRLLDIPTIGGRRNLLRDVSGKGNTTKLHLDLSCTEEDLPLQYVCSELLLVFQKIANNP
ncbi:hypothetical protein ABXV22_02765 [Vibrio rotiferianus]|uniref:hypothetical protein n=1 Tax=Vibrio rotiferianus TaxID=190895 RepID=UPI0033911A96